jgi:nitrous oxidase accessory protein
MRSIHKGFTLALILIFLTCLVTQPNTTVNASSKTITVPTNYPTIAEAIGNATDGETILVKSGTYTEQTIEINKSLTIMPQNNNEVTINFHPPQIPENIFGQTIMVYANPISIEASYVKLSGFTITSDGGDISANGNQIQITNNVIGTEKIPIGLQINGNGIQIIGNTMAKYSLLSSTGSNQTVVDNFLSGLSITGSFNFITGNNAGSMVLVGSENTVTGNFLNVNMFNGGNSNSGINLSGNYNIISNNTEIGNVEGIGVGDAVNADASYNIFAGNIVEDAGLWGILMGHGSYNVFYGNLIANSGGLGHDGYGLALGEEDIESATNNLFFGNIFMNNSKNFGTNWQVIGSNSFDNGKEGNYWDDYLTKYPNATEVDGSGIGNTTYLVYGNVTDNYPLMNTPNVSAAVPTLPSPWSSLLSTISSQLPSSNPTVPELQVWTVLLLLTLMLGSCLLVCFKKNKRKIIVGLGNQITCYKVDKIW